MRLGLISDIHADHAALERAFKVLERQGADKVVCMGDLVEKGPEGDRVVETLRANAIPTIRGNHDENVLRIVAELGRNELAEPLNDQTLSYLSELPEGRDYVWDGVRVKIAHGMPGQIDTYVFAEQLPKRFKRAVRSLEADVLLLGHTHRPMQLNVRGLRVINPGSVAGSRERDSHTCALLRLPSLELSVYSLDNGSELPLPPLEAEPDVDDASS
jgi:putative phosphoesterase